MLNFFNFFNFFKFFKILNKMKKIITTLFFLTLAVMLTAQEVSNIRVQVQEGVLIVTYDLAAKADIEAYVSFDDGATWRGPLKYVTGAVGKGIAAEKNKIFVWDAEQEVGYVDVDAIIKIVAITEAVTPCMLTAEGRDVYCDDELIDKYRVRELMANTEALQYYNKGLSRNRNGNILLVSGILGIAGGAYILKVAPLNERYEYYSSSYGNKQLLFYEYNNRNETVGYALAAAGAVMSITGFIMKLTSTIPVSKAVYMYNNSGETVSRVDINLGFTGNGVSLLFNF